MTRTPRHALWALIVITFGLRLLWASLVGAGNDEAYHYLYAVHPDWSYFDHPPMMMVIERVGLTLCGDTTLALRLGFILLFAASTWALFRWTACWYGEWAGFYAALALNFSAYFTAGAGAFALPDGPLLFFSLLTLWGLSKAVVEPLREEGSPATTVWPWVWVGLAWAGALLSKYHAIFLPVGTLLYLLVTPAARRCLRTPGPYLAAALGMCGFLPVLIWNLQHDWASFAFQGARAVGWSFRVDGLLALIGGQLMYLFPWIWAAFVLVLIRLLRAGRSVGGIERLLLCQSLAPFAFFLAVSCVTVPLPHWSLIGFVPLYPLLGSLWATMMAESPVKMRRSLVANGVLAVLIAAGIGLQIRLGILPLERDPSLEMRDWSPVARELEARGLVGRLDTFLFTNSWIDSGHLALALRNRAPVLCYDADARGFAYWSRPADWVGKDGILVLHCDNMTEQDNYKRYFRRIELVAHFPITRNGRYVCTTRVFHCIDQMEPFPFRPAPPDVPSKHAMAKTIVTK